MYCGTTAIGDDFMYRGFTGAAMEKKPQQRNKH
jgi:hypothetical protein